MDKSFTWEMICLAYERLGEKLMDDRFLSQFDSAWRGLPHNETGLMDGNVPQSYYDAFLKAMGLKQEGDNPSEGQYNLENSGLTLFFDPDTGHMLLQGANGQAVVHKDDLPKVVDAIQGKRPPDVVQGGSSPANPNAMGMTVYGQSSSNLTPQLKAQLKRNLKTLEKLSDNPLYFVLL